MQNPLDNSRVIKKADPFGMLRFLMEFDKQCEQAYNIGTSLKIPSDLRGFENIIFCGLGGSAIGADILRVYLQKKVALPILIIRNYTLPNFVNQKTLAFISSYSGNTEETISAFHESLKRGAKIITVSSGGRVKNLAKRFGVFHIDIPTGFPPRTALMFMSIPILLVLSQLGLIEAQDRHILSLIDNLKALRELKLGPHIPLRKNISKNIAAKLYNKFPVIYGTSDTTEAVAYRWRTQIAENAKHLSSSHIFPEMSHNEIVGWEFPKSLIRKFKVVILHDREDHQRNAQRVKITKSVIRRSGAEVLDEEAAKGDLLSRIYSLIYIGDFVSFYLAVLNRVDPTPVKRVEYLKKELAKL